MHLTSTALPSNNVSSRASLLNVYQQRLFLSELPEYVVGSVSTLFSSSSEGSGNCIIPLPASFKPAELDIVCGRGRGVYLKAGSVRCRAIVRELIPRYEAAKSCKSGKRIVLTEMVERVQQPPEGSTQRIRFVKQKKGVGYELSFEQAREKANS